MSMRAVTEDSTYTSQILEKLTRIRAHFFCLSQNRQPHTRDQRPEKSSRAQSWGRIHKVEGSKKHTEHERNAKR